MIISFTEKFKERINIIEIDFAAFYENTAVFQQIQNLTNLDTIHVLNAVYRQNPDQNDIISNLINNNAKCLKNLELRSVHSREVSEVKIMESLPKLTSLTLESCGGDLVSQIFTKPTNLKKCVMAGVTFAHWDPYSMLINNNATSLQHLHLKRVRVFPTNYSAGSVGVVNLTKALSSLIVLKLESDCSNLENHIIPKTSVLKKCIVSDMDYRNLKLSDETIFSLMDKNASSLCELELTDCFAKNPSDTGDIVSKPKPMPNLKSLQLVRCGTKVINQITSRPTNLKNFRISVGYGGSGAQGLSGEILSGLMNRNASSLVDVELDNYNTQGIVSITETMPILASLQLIGCCVEVVNQIAAQPTNLKNLKLFNYMESNALINGGTLSSLFNENAPTLEQIDLTNAKSENFHQTVDFAKLESLSMSECGEVITNQIFTKVFKLKRLELRYFKSNVSKDSFFSLLNNSATSLEHAQLSGLHHVCKQYTNKVVKLQKLKYLKLNDCKGGLVRTLVVNSAASLETLTLDNNKSWNLYIPTPIPNLREFTYNTPSYLRYNVDLTHCLLKTEAGFISHLRSLTKSLDF